MPAANTRHSYGSVTRLLHWLTALLIATQWPLGLYADALAWDTPLALAWKAQVFSVHKTLGVAIFAVALLRILWALSQPKPAPLHPARRAETWLAEATHWSLYGALVVVPLSGWVAHAAAAGFAPILWPPGLSAFGQSLPLIPKSPAWEAAAAAVHTVFAWVLAATIALHVAGALKHAAVDRDATLARMLPGPTDLRGVDPAAPHRHGPALIGALALYLAGFGVAVAIVPPEAARPAAQSLAAAQGGNWQVADGTLSITVQQLGSAVSGSFADWTADIDFAEAPAGGSHGHVTVTVSIPSLTLGSVTEQAMGADYFDAEAFSAATFDAAILPAPTGAGYVADGTLTLRGVTAPLALPFDLQIDGDTARMTGRTVIDRRSHGIGAAQSDPGMLGFDVVLDIALAATRAD